MEFFRTAMGVGNGIGIIGFFISKLTSTGHEQSPVLACKSLALLVYPKIIIDNHSVVNHPSTRSPLA
ncbi:MAG: hypothetical protein ACRDEA_04540 [Microcystaceae cyanobacterium]